MSDDTADALLCLRHAGAEAGGERSPSHGVVWLAELGQGHAGRDAKRGDGRGGGPGLLGFISLSAYYVKQGIRPVSSYGKDGKV